MANMMKAFTLRLKKSKAGKEYYIAPYGDCDLIGFQQPNGDINVSYSDRAPARSAAPPQQAPRHPQSRPKIIPREPRPTITPRQQAPIMERPEEALGEENLPDWMNEPFIPDENGY